MNCYLLALCRSSSLDRDTSTFSLFSMTKDIQVLGFTPRMEVPIEAHIYLELAPEEIGTDIEMRGVWIGEDGARTSGEPNKLPTTARFVQSRSVAIRLPPTLGLSHFTAEWRSIGDLEWKTLPTRWPLMITAAESPALPPVPPPAA